MALPRKYVATLLSAILFSEALLAVMLVGSSQSNSSIHSSTHIALPVPLQDSPMPADPAYAPPPKYYQDDPQWAAIPYASKTVAEGGCGLCAFASALSYLMQDKSITPETLVAQVGDSCTVYDDSGQLVNDVGLFVEYAVAHYPVYSRGIYWQPAEALRDLEAGAVVLAGAEGRVVDEWYDGHIVLLWWDDGMVKVFDPKSSTNREVSAKDFSLSDWMYFYSLERTDEI